MNGLVKYRVNAAREKFIDSLDPTTICQLASSHNNGQPCNMFGKPMSGSYNICYPVIFSPENGAKPAKWVVRIPIPPCVAFVDEKLESEIATMRFVAEKTTIPVPRIHGYAFERDNSVGFAYMIIDYIEGQTLSEIDFLKLSPPQKEHLWEQLGGIYVQLRVHEFPHIGSLGLADNNSGWTCDVPRRPLSIELNAQEIEGLQPSEIFKKDVIFTTAKDYFTALVALAFNLFTASQNSLFDEEGGQRTLYCLHHFKAIVEEWADPLYDSGPFVLDHRDLRPFNIRVDEELNIVGILDWEWAHIVPIQLFMPPTWLTGRELSRLCMYFEEEKYTEEVALFKNILKSHGTEATPLIEDWKRLQQEGAFLVAGTLPIPLLMEDIYCIYFDIKRHNSDKSCSERIQEFFQDNQSCQDLIKMKIEDRALYLQSLKDLGFEEDDDGIVLPIKSGQETQINVSGLGRLKNMLPSSWLHHAYLDYCKDRTILSISTIAIIGCAVLAASLLRRHFK